MAAERWEEIRDALQAESEFGRKTATWVVLENACKRLADLETVLWRIRQDTAEFRNWTEADADQFDEQEDLVAEDHNRMLSRLVDVHDRADVAARSVRQPRKEVSGG